jgi:2-C-methyl-D-erythritol 2,4-cyclodiphosphate synthase
MDALLGALALGDIGTHFPDTDPAYAGCDSLELLTEVAGMVRSRGWNVGNIDTTVCAQAPRLAPFMDGMRRNVSRALDVAEDAVSVKATTTERLGFVGREEGISSFAVAAVVSGSEAP